MRKKEAAIHLEKAMNEVDRTLEKLVPYIRELDKNSEEYKKFSYIVKNLSKISRSTFPIFIGNLNND